MDEVCDIKDCPMYGYFTDMSKYPQNVQISEKINKKIQTIEDSFQSISYGLIVLSNNIRLRSLCSSCCHFSKPDMSKILIKNEAKKALSEE